MWIRYFIIVQSKLGILQSTFNKSFVRRNIKTGFFVLQNISKTFFSRVCDLGREKKKSKLGLSARFSVFSSLCWALLLMLELKR